MGMGAYGRLVRAFFVLAREGAFSLVKTDDLPGPARFGIGVARLIERRAVRRTGRVERLTHALNRLGPTYVKFGQTLATRPDIVGPEIAEDLSKLQDKMEPFDQSLVAPLLKKELGDKADAITDISAPVAAASIAQVHRATLQQEDGSKKPVAIKLLRPGVRTRFAKDLESFFVAARWGERLSSEIRRLRPMAVVDTLKRSARLELDFRFEAAAISEFDENLDDEHAIIVPELFWVHCSPGVLTTSWLDGIPVRELDELDKAGIDRKKLAADLLEGFLRHAIGTGFFHADMHPGNLFAERGTGRVMMVDFGIMGRITRKERRFLAEILHGFITRDYERMAKLHIEIGYVPSDQNVHDFAAALRSIGEPMHGRRASDISMAKVLGQLFAVTELFNMKTRPELVLLQKNMVLVEGVSRMIDPELDIWTVSRPFVSDWVRREAGPLGRIEALGEFVQEGVQVARRARDLIEQGEQLMQAHREQLDRGNNGRAGRGLFFLLAAIAAGAIGAIVVNLLS